MPQFRCPVWRGSVRVRVGYDGGMGPKRLLFILGVVLAVVALLGLLGVAAVPVIPLLVAAVICIGIGLAI